MDGKKQPDFFMTSWRWNWHVLLVEHLWKEREKLKMTKLWASATGKVTTISW